MTDIEKDAAGQKVIDMFSAAIDELTVLVQVDPARAASITRELIDQFTNLRELIGN